MPTRKPAPAAAPRRISLKDVARLTGFSVTTVSLVLNGRASRFHISPATRDLVLRAAQEHGYHPNLHARGLRSATSGLVGLMVPTLKNPFFDEMAETFERLARADGKLALIAVTRHDAREELTTLRWFLGQRVDCVFTANPTALEAAAALCRGAGTRHLLLDAEARGEHTVSTDNRGAALALTRRLLDSLAAAQRPGRLYFVGGAVDHAISGQRLEGFAAALAERGLPFSPELFLPTRFDAELACRRLRTLLRRRSDDVGGIFLNAVPALEGLIRALSGAPAWCRQLHLGVFDHHPMMSLLDLRILILKQDPEQMMRTAYQLFASGTDRERGRSHHTGYEIVCTPSMRALLGPGEPAG